MLPRLTINGQRFIDKLINFLNVLQLSLNFKLSLVKTKIKLGGDKLLLIFMLKFNPRSVLNSNLI